MTININTFWKESLPFKNAQAPKLCKINQVDIRKPQMNTSIKQEEC